MRPLAALLFLALAPLAHAADPSPLTLWYDKPASPRSGMNEALVVGNGRLGAMIYGDPDSERIALNEDSLWSGGINPSGAYDTRPTRTRSGNDIFGSYELLGDLLITLPGHEAATNYRRDLDLATALATVQYQHNGTTFRRELFASAPDHVLVLHLTADRPAGYTGTLTLRDAHARNTTAQGNNTLLFAGSLPNDLAYEAQLTAINDGGTLSTTDGKISFSNCNSLTLVIAAGTNYAMNYAAEYRGTNPHDRITQQLKAASAKSFDQLQASQRKDYQSLFNRLSLDLGQTPADRKALPTDKRRLLAANGGDPELEALLVQLGRYLLISSSRPGSLPANLQGLWVDRNDPAWGSDYHANINIQMNYWPAEVANLSDCHLPLFDLIQSQLEPWRKATQAEKEFQLPDGKPVRGWAIRTSHNIFGGLGWNWDKTANAWYCLHLWEHYAFTGDKQYLQTTAYPILKETCQFWEDHLKALPDGAGEGKLVVPNGWSPEHGPHEDGVSYNQEIVWDLFNNYVEASAILNIDPDYRAKITAMRDKLITPGIGSWGQLLEWMQEEHLTGNDAVLDTPDDHHRHTSHLFAVYPGRQISIEKTPKLAEAAKISLAARGNTGDVREWSYAWRTALWARLHEGDRALDQVRQFFTDKNSCPNLFGLHPPMQIDGNFGLAAAIPEMLLQSQTGEIVLLPALPKDWPTGSVKGLRARGGFEVDIEWRGGQLTSAKIRSTSGGHAAIRCDNNTFPIDLKPGEERLLDRTENFRTRTSLPRSPNPG